MNSTRRRLRPATWIGAAIVLSPVLFLGGVAVINNISAMQYEVQLLDLDLPPETELVDSTWAVSRFAPAGNGTHYAGALLVRSDLGAESLQAFYDTQPGEPIVSGGSVSAGMNTSGLFEPKYDLDEPGLYMVLLKGAPTSSVLSSADIRGH